MPIPRNTPLNELGLPVGTSLRAGMELSPRDAKTRLEAGTLLLIDCRTKEEWETVRVAGSVHVPLHELESRVDEIDPGPGQEVAVICHHGVRSIKGALALRSLGHPAAYSVAGGIDLWAIAADPTIAQYERGPGGCRAVSG